MVSRIVDITCGMRLEIQLVNANTWLSYGRLDRKNATPVECFVDMLTEGSAELDAIIIRNNCPYLFKIWSQPIFDVNGYNSAQRPKQSGSLFLQAFDETIVGVIFSYLSETDLTRSVSAVCFHFRSNIASRKHVETLLGNAVSTEMNQLFIRAKSRSKDSATALSDRLMDMAGTIDNARSAFYSTDLSSLSSRAEDLSKVDAAILTIFPAIDDCAKRLVQLATGLTAKNMLETEKKNIDNVLRSIKRVTQSDSLAHRSLLHLLGACLTYGWGFGSKLRHPYQVAGSLNDEAMLERFQGFQFASLKDLQDIKSRFHRPFTPAVAVLLHIAGQQLKSTEFTPKQFERGIKELDQALFVLCGETTGSVFQIMDSARSALLKVRKVGRAAKEHIDSSPLPSDFHVRLFHLFRLLEPLCRELEDAITSAADELVSLTSWLVPMRVDHEEQSIFVKIHGTNGELKCLGDFVHHCAWLLTPASSGETCEAIRDLAMTVTALEQSAIAKNASQRALFRQNSAPQSSVSEGFASARNLVARTLDPSPVAALDKEARMSQMMREVLSEEEQERRRVQLQETLRLRLPGSQPPIEQPDGDAEDEDSQVDLESARALPGSIASQIRAMRDTDVGEDEVTLNELQTVDVRDTGESQDSPETSSDLKPMRDTAVGEETATVNQLQTEDVRNTDESEDPPVTETESDHEVLEESNNDRTETEVAIIATSPPRAVFSPSQVHGSPRSSINTPPSGSGAELKSTKLWNWLCFSTEQQSSVWQDLHRANYVYLIPIQGEEESTLQKLFSRGPEVALTVTSTHQKLKHFTSEDFSGMRSTRALASKRDQAQTSLVDMTRTKKAVESLPQVRRAREDEISEIEVKSPLGAVAEEAASAPNEQLILPLERLKKLKQDGKLGTLNLKPSLLETYLSEDDFERSFRMSRTQFQQLAAWKRDKLKKDIGIF